MTNLVPLQTEFRQELPVVIGNIDYKIFRETLMRIEEIIELSGAEKKAMRYAVEKEEEERKQKASETGEEYRGLSHKEKVRIQKKSCQAFRCGVARHLTGESYREFSCHLADSALLQKFCLIDHLDRIKVPSKSTLQRYAQMFQEGVIQEIVQDTIKAAGAVCPEGEEQELKLEEAISMEDLYYDTTCVEANIHFPVDWVLLRDAVRTLMKGVKLIRREGLKNRMADPSEFIREINKLSIRMTNTRRKKGGKKKRKKTLRLMKKLLKRVAKHAEKHKILLIERLEETGLTERQAGQILKRIDNVLEQLPGAVYQAHERIIGERRVKNKDKILSLYEREVHVIVRGKASAEVEFGNTLVMGEQKDGIIVDWKMYREQAPADSRLLKERLKKMEEDYDGYQPDRVTTDRGFYSRMNKSYLEDAGITDCMCPRNVDELKERLKEKEFRKHQKRRSQTEGRIAILKNNFLGKPLRSKGFSSRKRDVAWGILAHNFWVIARLPKAMSEEYEKAS